MFMKNAFEIKRLYEEARATGEYKDIRYYQIR